VRGAARKGGPYRDKACPDTAVRIVADGEREPAERLTRKAVSTVAGCAGGPARSSGEASAGRGGGGAKGPGHPWCVRLINRERASGRSRVDRLKPSGCACVGGPGGQDDRSPVTRDCHAGICGSRRVRPPRRPGNVREVERILKRSWALDEDGVRAQVWRNILQLVEETGTADLFGTEWQTAFALARA
jgi:hypothetical protein